MKMQKGFTLIELMIAVVVLGIISAIAVPAYQDYAKQSKVSAGFGALSEWALRMEQYRQDNRTYMNGTNCGASVASAAANSAQDFAFTCTGDATTFTLTATGSGSLNGFEYTINQNGVKTSTTNWGNSNNCWVRKAGGAC